jgi:hypothetical protein
MNNFKKNFKVPRVKPFLSPFWSLEDSNGLYDIKYKISPGGLENSCEKVGTSKSIQFFQRTNVRSLGSCCNSTWTTNEKGTAWAPTLNSQIALYSRQTSTLNCGQPQLFSHSFICSFVYFLFQFAVRGVLYWGFHPEEDNQLISRSSFNNITPALEDCIFRTSKMVRDESIGIMFYRSDKQ